MDNRELIGHIQARLNCTQAELAEALDVTTRTIVRWAGGEDMPGPARLLLEAALEVEGMMAHLASRIPVAVHEQDRDAREPGGRSLDGGEMG